MRQLNKKQKKLLKEQFDAGVESVDDLPLKAYEAIKSINPHETFWQNADRFLSDLVFEDLRNRNPLEYHS